MSDILVRRRRMQLRQIRDPVTRNLTYNLTLSLGTLSACVCMQKHNLVCKTRTFRPAIKPGTSPSLTYEMSDGEDEVVCADGGGG